METDAEASGIQSWLFGFCERHIDHNPNTPLSDFFQPYGVAPYAAGENRIGGHKHSSFRFGSVRSRVRFDCETTNNPRPLAFEACLNSREIRTSVGTSPGTVQYTRLGQQSSLALLVSPQNGLLSVAVVSSPEHACVCIIRWSLALCGGATERSRAGKSARAHPLH